MNESAEKESDASLYRFLFRKSKRKRCRGAGFLTSRLQDAGGAAFAMEGRNAAMAKSTL